MPSFLSFRLLFSSTVCCLLLSGCEFSFSGNSSSGKNDYFEEPLSKIVQEYAPALESSNRFVAQFRDKQIAEIHAGLTKSLQNAISIDELSAMHDTVVSAAGQVTEFLPQQWAFKTATQDDHDVLYSTKIVIHENGELLYILMFLDDGNYEKIQGIKINTRYNGERVMEGVDRILSEAS